MCLLDGCIKLVVSGIQSAEEKYKHELLSDILEIEGLRSIAEVDGSIHPRWLSGRPPECLVLPSGFLVELDVELMFSSRVMKVGNLGLVSHGEYWCMYST